MNKEKILHKHAPETLVFPQHYNDHIFSAMDEYCQPLIDALKKARLEIQRMKNDQRPLWGYNQLDESELGNLGVPVVDDVLKQYNQ